MIFFFEALSYRKRLERDFYVIHEAKEKGEKTLEKTLMNPKGFRIYMQQLSLRKVLHVISLQRKIVDSGQWKLYLLHADIFQ